MLYSKHRWRNDHVRNHIFMHIKIEQLGYRSYAEDGGGIRDEDIAAEPSVIAIHNNMALLGMEEMDNPLI